MKHTMKWNLPGCSFIATFKQSHRGWFCIIRGTNANGFGAAEFYKRTRIEAVGYANHLVTVFAL